MTRTFCMLSAAMILILSCSNNHSSNSDDVQLTEERFNLLVSAIPDHGMGNSPESAYTAEYYSTLRTAWEVPDDGLSEIGDNEFLWYFVCGNDPCTHHSGEIKDISISDSTAIVKFNIIHEYGRDPEPHTFKLALQDGEWIIADYDNTLSEMKEYIEEHK